MLIKNAILANLSPACFAAILPFLEQVTLKERLSLQGPRKPVEHVYFVESGIVSLRTVASEGFAELATIGVQAQSGSPVCWAGTFQRINQSYSFLEAQSGSEPTTFGAYSASTLNSGTAYCDMHRAS